MNLKKLIFLLALAAFVAFVFAAPAAYAAEDEVNEDGADYFECMDDGNKYLKKGRYDYADEYFSDALELKEGDAAALEGLLRVYLETGRYNKAAARGLEGGTARARTMAAEALMAVGKYDEALKALDKALEVDKGFLRARANKGEILILKGRKKEAEEILQLVAEASLEKEDPTPEELVAIARACEMLNMYQDAAEQFTQAYRKDKEYVPLYVPWAYIYLTKYNYPDAKKTFLDLLEINPYHAEALVGKATCMLRSPAGGADRYGNARGVAESALDVNPKCVSALNFLGYVFFVEERLDDSLAQLEKSLDVNPNDISTLALAAAVYYFDDQTDKFNEMKDRAFKVNPKCARFYEELAGIVDQRYLYEESRQFALKAIELDNESWMAYYKAGINISRTGDIETGRKYLKTAFDNDPYNVRCYNLLELFDYMDREFEEYKFGEYVLRINKQYADILKPYYEEAFQRLVPELAEKYGFKPEGPYTAEVFDRGNYFSARTIGLPGIPALGVCFGTFVIVDSPVAMRGRECWEKTFRHELAHTITLSMTNFRIPRWLTEGISVYEEKCGRPEWDREYDQQFFNAFHQGRLLGVKEINRGFHRPKYRAEVMLVYYQAHVIVEWIINKWGAQKITEMCKAYAAKKDTPQVIEEVLGLTCEEFDEQFFAHCKSICDGWDMKPPYSRKDVLRLKYAIDDGEKTASNYIELATAYLDTGKKRDCEINLAKAERENPDNAQIYVLKGKIMLQKMGKDEEKKQQAMDYFKKALELAPRYDKTDTYYSHYVLGSLYLQAKDYKAALPHMKAVKKAFPRNARAYGSLYTIYDKLGEKDKAMAELEELFKFEHKNIRARITLGQYYYDKEEWDKLITLSEQIAAMNPFVQKAHFWAGEALRKKKEYKKAIQSYTFSEKTGELSKKKDEWIIDMTYKGLAECYDKTGDSEKSKEYADKVKNVSRSGKEPEGDTLKPHEFGEEDIIPGKPEGEKPEEEEKPDNEKSEKPGGE